MELLSLLWALYLVQCLVHLPRGATLFGGGAPSEGPGWRLERLRPSARILFGERTPAVERRGRLCWRGVASRLFATDVPALSSKALDAMEPGSALEADGPVVRVGDAPRLRSVSHAGAEAVASALDAAAGPAALRRAIEGLAADEISLERLRDRRARLEAATRPLRWHLDLQAAALLVILPAASAFWGIEAALWRAAPALAALHVLGAILFTLAHRRLLPGRSGALALSLFEVAVYPPALLRSFQKLQVEALGRHHPATVAVATLSEAAGREFLRREFARLEHSLTDGDGWLRAAELRTLEGLAEAAGTSKEQLLVAPGPVDPHAVAYCPSCLTEFGRSGSECSECRIEVVVFPASPEAADRS